MASGGGRKSAGGGVNSEKFRIRKTAASVLTDSRYYRVLAAIIHLSIIITMKLPFEIRRELNSLHYYTIVNSIT